MKLLHVSWCSTPVNIPGIGLNDYETETAFQTYCADWLRKQYELTRDQGFIWWHHSANERDGVKAGAVAKLMGQSKGFPDFINCRLKIAVEFKLPHRSASKEQIAWLRHFAVIDWHSEIVTSFERFRELVLEKIRKNRLAKK